MLRRRWAVLWIRTPAAARGHAAVMSRHWTAQGAVAGMLRLAARKGPWTLDALEVAPTVDAPYTRRGLWLCELMRDGELTSVGALARRTAWPPEMVEGLLLDLGRKGWAVSAVVLGRPPRWRLRSPQELLDEERLRAVTRQSHGGDQ